MVPGMILREWSLAEQRRQERLKEAAQLHLLAAIHTDAAAPGRAVRLRAGIRAFGRSFLGGLSNASLERPRFGPRAFRDELG